MIVLIFFALHHCFLYFLLNSNFNLTIISLAFAANIHFLKSLLLHLSITSRYFNIVPLAPDFRAHLEKILKSTKV